MRPIFILSFVAGAYAVGDSYPFNPVVAKENKASTDDLKYSDQTTTTSRWLASGASGQCASGSNQSPIDIVTASATIPTDDPGMPMINNLNPKQDYHINIGNYYAAVSAGVSDAESADGTGLTIWQKAWGIGNTDFGVPTLTGGPFDAGDSYNFAFGEFKWHQTSDTLGSEHSIDGTFAPLELQMVFLKSTTAELATTGAKIGAQGDWYTHVKKVAEATTVDPSAVAVISYQFEIGDTDNAELAYIIKELPAVGATSTIPTDTTIADIAVNGYNMSALLNPDNTNMLEDYYYYDGSLTLPGSVEGDVATMGCNEIVRWLIPTTKLSLSAAQLDAFQGSDLADAIHLQQGPSLARIIQNNANTVYHRKKPTSTDIWQSLATSLLSVGTFGLVHTFLTQPDTAKALTENPIVDVLADFEQRFVNPIATADQRSAPNHHRHNPQF
jgi:carbonic anhydrase